MSLDARVLKPTGKGDFGFVCRYTDNKNLYLLRVGEDRLFAIEKFQDGEAIPLVKWSYSNDIPEVQGKPMHLTASCIDDKLSLSINGKLLGEVTDNTFPSGPVGLVAGATDKAGLEVSFTNFKINQPSK